MHSDRKADELRRSTLFAGLEDYLRRFAPDGAAFANAMMEALQVPRETEREAERDAEQGALREEAVFEADEDLFIGSAPRPAGSPSRPHGSCAAAPSLRPSGASRPGPSTLEQRIAHKDDTFQETLLRMIDERGYTDTEVYKRAMIDRKHFSKIRGQKDYRPKKKTAVLLALALRLSLDETRDLLACAGYALSHSSRADLIVEYFIENEVYDLDTIDLALYDHGEPMLSD